MTIDTDVDIMTKDIVNRYDRYIVLCLALRTLALQSFAIALLIQNVKKLITSIKFQTLMTLQHCYFITV